MAKSLEDLRKLQHLQQRLRSGLVASVPALSWFATRFARNGKTPLNAWRRRDRPLPKESEALGLAYDVWHAILRAERALRLSSEPGGHAETLLEAANRLKTKLDQLTVVPARRTPSSDVDDYARRIASDEIYGTFNMLSCASVLRAEVFPERSYSTPSYVAGHILMAELQAARRYAQTHSVTGIKERTPRLFAISQGVHGLTLYVNHLRKRASRFTAIATELKAIESIHLTATAIGSCNEIDEALDARLRTGMARLSSLCDDAAELLVSTRDYFRSLREQFYDAYTNRDPLSFFDLKRIVRKASEELSAHPARASTTSNRDVLRDQRDTYELAASFCSRLSDQISAAEQSLKALLAASESEAKYSTLVTNARDLRSRLDELALTHEAGATPLESPSLRDSSRFQVLERLTGLFRRASGGWLENTESRKSVLETAQEQIRQFRDAYSLGELHQRQHSGPPSEWRSALRETVRQFNRSSLGNSVVDWWANYAECYRCPRPEDINTHITDGRPADADGRWLRLRHRSFQAIRTLVEALREVRNIGHVAHALSEAAKKESDIAEAIEIEVKELTQWCRSRGHQLILAGQNDVSYVFDPLELISAMWIADMLGEPWSEKTEQAAFNVVAALQRPNGTFPAVAPLFQNRGFAYYPPSASVVGLLARFVTRGTTAPKHQRLHSRLRRWESVLSKGAEFLLDSMVRGDETSQRAEDSIDLAGWQSDRHPQNDRIDCLATTEAVTALCRLDDAMMWLTNLEAAADFSVTWPPPAWHDALPSDGGKRERQHLLTVSGMIRQLRGGTELYKAACGHVRDSQRKHAFVFYGPPGTGKTYSQELLAGELGWPLITVTIGDVLRDGADMIGHRLSEIFERLGYLRNACIVFDEFDEMVTDRPRRRDRGWVGLQLLTATMLPLLSTFRDRIRQQSCAVSFTTNYLENIDRAATRVGRVDAVELLAYPDYVSRTLLALVELDRAKRRTSDEIERRPVVGIGPLKIAVQDTAMCARPDVMRYLRNFVSGSQGSEPPSSPIDAAYYQLPGRLSAGARKDLRTILNTIGPPPIRDAWLHQNAAWNEVYNLAELRLQERTEDALHRPITLKVDAGIGRSFHGKLIDYADGGLRVEAQGVLLNDMKNFKNVRIGATAAGGINLVANITNYGTSRGSWHYGLKVVDNYEGWKQLVQRWRGGASGSQDSPDRPSTAGRKPRKRPTKRV
jgi:ATPase family protein associated with various cellular activities (AAA)